AIIGNNNLINYTAATTSRALVPILGSGNQILHRNSQIWGANQITTAERQCIIANYQSNVNAGFTDYYLGIGIRAGGDSRGIVYTPSTVNIRGSGAGFGTDTLGGAIRIVAGLSVGAGASPDILFATA